MARAPLDPTRSTDEILAEGGVVFPRKWKMTTVLAFLGLLVSVPSGLSFVGARTKALDVQVALDALTPRVAKLEQVQDRLQVIQTHLCRECVVVHGNTTTRCDAICDLTPGDK